MLFQYMDTHASPVVEYVPQSRLGGAGGSPRAKRSELVNDRLSILLRTQSYR